MINLDQTKVTPREQQVLNLLVQGCSNKEIGGQLSISLRTVKQHLRILFLRAGIREGDKRVKLARYAREDDSAVVTPCKGLSVMDRVPHLMTAEQIDSLHTLARRTMHELELRRTREAPARHEGIRLTAARASEDVKSIQTSRCSPELVAVQVNA